MKSIFIYSDEFWRYDYGNEHPMKPVRLKITYELIREYGLFDAPAAEIAEGRKASFHELLLVHTNDYINALQDANDGFIEPSSGLPFSLGAGDNPVFPGVYDWSLASVGASIQAAELILAKKTDTAFNICGGLHHAMGSKASGFCYLNDGAVAIQHLVDAGKRVAYIDIDAHHGDGVQSAFYDSDRVLTISLHESGRSLFPGTGFPDEIGTGKGRGFSINLPVPPGADDTIFTTGFDLLLPPLIECFKPDVVVTQLGVDTFRSDPLTHLNLTTEGFEKMVRAIGAFNLPWVALGGGGYNMSNVARAWTLAWAIMCNTEVENEIPRSFSTTAAEFGIAERSLRDQPFSLPPHEQAGILAEQERTAAHILETVLPLIKHT